MNIKDHIEAGHYGDTPVVEVPTRCGQIARIYSTRHPSNWCIVGVAGEGNGAQMWPASGRISGSAHHDEPFDLMPPPPRKVKVTRYIQVCPRNGGFSTIHKHPSDLPFKHADGWQMVELTGEYEEPWT